MNILKRDRAEPPAGDDLDVAIANIHAIRSLANSIHEDNVQIQADIRKVYRQYNRLHEQMNRLETKLNRVIGSGREQADAPDAPPPGQ